MIPGNSIKAAVTLCMLAGLTACQSTGPVAPVESAGETESPVYKEPSSEQKSRTSDNVSALEAILQRGIEYTRAQRWFDAIHSAETGLRMDRREPRLYWILSTSYLAMGDAAKAKEFARQGLRYAPSGSLLARQLKNIIGE